MFIAAAALAMCSSGTGAQTGPADRYDPPSVAGFQPPQEVPSEAEHLDTTRQLSVYLPLHSHLFSDTTIIDFEKRQITFVRRDSLGFIVWTYHYDEMGEYLADRKKAAFAEAWLQSAGAQKGAADGSKNDNFKLAWELPVQYPGWAQRVLGNEPPRLTINGSLRIKIAYEGSSIQQSSAVQQAQRGGAGFNFEEQNQFTITGSVGRLININISANSEGDVNMNNPLKNFKIEYKESKPGELEDEVVQEVTAGYTGFSMPGTQLSGYSESKEGLFGIKVATKFGPLMLTTIASNEEGESQKLSVNNSGKGGSGTMSTKNESEFLKNRYYFLDTSYIRYYNKKYAINGGDPNAPAPPQVTELQVWITRDLHQTGSNTSSDPSRQPRNFSIDSSSRTTQQFVPMQAERDYRLYPKEGYIRFFDSSCAKIRDEDIIAIWLRTTDPKLSKGDTAAKYLWVLKPDKSVDSLGADPERFRLMWRNVYELPGDIQDITKFKFRVYHVNTDNLDTIKTIGNTHISDLMGLTKNGDPLTIRQDIFNFDNKELIIPPPDTGDFGNEPFANWRFKDKDLNLRDTLVYRYHPQATVMIQYKPKFSMEMSGTSKQTKFDLGIGVMENTVRVNADGTLLQPNIDYVLSTDVGTLELTSPRALAAQKVDIEYQREALFMPERKLFLGARAEMQLPFVSDKSLVGLSVLYQSTSISQKIPRINQEPFSKILLDFNTRLDFQPAWMTTLVNKIPLVKTDAPSSVTVEFETAHSMMNPNTDKQAYVDDFESSKQVYSLGESYRTWYPASPPYSKDSLSYYPPVWDQYWFTPVYSDAANRVDRDSVWDQTGEPPYTGVDKWETVLRLHVMPSPRSTDLQARYGQAWAGIMTPVPKSMAKRDRDQYFELLVNCPTPDKGRLRIQMGELREDLCISGGPPNGLPNREDTALYWTENHDPNLDRGLDTLLDNNERWFVPNGAGGWDTLAYGNPSLGDWSHDPGKDNYRLYDENNSGNYRNASRYEKDGWATATEDINNDGAVDVSSKEQYHEYIIDLSDPKSPFIDTTAKLVKGRGWRRYRLPLHEMTPGGVRREVNIGANDWNNIRFVRLIWDGFGTGYLTTEHKLMVSSMQFVGNQWEVQRDSAGRSKIDVSSIGTRESWEYKQSLDSPEAQRLIERQLDETNNYQPEQSLRLQFSGILPGEDAWAARSFAYQPLTVASYDNLTLAVYGKPPPGSSVSGPLYNGKLKFIFRFGSDSTTYYEVRQKIFPYWKNYININLKELSELKRTYLQNNTGGNAMYAFRVSDGDTTLLIVAPKGRQPNFANISWIAVGVIRDAGDDATGLNGELWVDELKVSGIKQFNGWSSRLNVTTQFADFLTVNGGLNYEGGDFRTMTDTRTTFGDSKISGNLSLSTGLDKFMPRSWNVSMPIGGSFTSSLTRPQLKPNTDVYLTDRNNQPDGFFELASDAVNRIAGRDIINSPVTKAEHYETETYGQSFFINYSKSGTAPNPAVDLLLNRVTTNFQYNMNTSQARRGERPSDSGGGDYMNIDSNRTYSGGIKYDMSPRNPPQWTKWRPFAGAGAQRLRDLEFSLLPSTVSLGLANASYTKTFESRYEPGTPKISTYSSMFTLSHDLQVNYTPIRPLLDLSYSLSVSRGFPNSQGPANSGALDFLGEQVFALYPHGRGGWRDYYILNRERSRSQKFKLSTNPQFVDWLTNSADYSADYTGTMTTWGNDSTHEYINAQVNSGVSYTSTLGIGTLLGGGGGFIARLKKGCDFIGLSSVNFNYSASSNLTNRFLDAGFLSSTYGGKERVGSAGFLAYQLGLKGRGVRDIVSGDMNDNTALGGMRYRDTSNSRDVFFRDDNRIARLSYQVSTSLGLSRPFDLQLSPITLRWAKQFTVQPDPSKFDTSWTDPEFGITARTGVLNKISLLSTYAQGMNLSSTFSLSRTREHGSSSGFTNDNSTGFSPLVSIDGTVRKWPIRFSYQHTMSFSSKESRTNQKEPNPGSTTKRNGDNVDISYEIQQSSSLSTIKLFKWTVPVRGRTSMGMRVARDHTVMTVGEQTLSDNSSFSATPHLSYVFTDNVTGTLEYTNSRTTQNGSITTNNTMAAIVDIKF